MRPTKQFVQHLPMKHNGQGALRGNKARANVLTTQVRVSRRIRTPLLGLVVKIYIENTLMHQHTWWYWYSWSISSWQGNTSWSSKESSIDNIFSMLIFYMSNVVSKFLYSNYCETIRNWKLASQSYPKTLMIQCSQWRVNWPILIIS